MRRETGYASGMNLRNMICFAALICGAVAHGAPAAPVKKPAAKQPAAVAAKPVDYTAKIETAVRGKVTAHFTSKDRMVGSAGAAVRSVSVKIGGTEPVSGWAGRYRTSGTAELNITGGGVQGGAQKQTRSFSAYSTVDQNGTVTVTEVSS